MSGIELSLVARSNRRPLHAGAPRPLHVPNAPKLVFSLGKEGGELVEQFRGWRTRPAILHLDDGFLELGHLSPLELFELDDISRTSRNTIGTPSRFCCLWPPLSLTWRALQINVVCLQASLLQALHVKLASNAFLLLVCHQFCVHNLCCFGCSTCEQRTRAFVVPRIYTVGAPSVGTWPHGHRQRRPRSRPSTMQPSPTSPSA